jgi:hypothetical protein
MYTAALVIFCKKGPLMMRSWILLGLILAACSTTTMRDGAPTVQIVQPTATVVPAIPTAQPTLEAESIVPNIAYQYHPRTQLLERITDATTQQVSQGVTAQQVVANHDHTTLAIRTTDDTTMLHNVATGLAIGPFDACDSMVWAPDAPTLWCMRFGHVYAIDGANQTDQLSITAADDSYWAALTQHPFTQAYWMHVIGGAESKLCQFNTETRIVEGACLSVGQLPRWSPDGQLVASIVHQRLVIHQANDQLVADIGLGDMQVIQIVWLNTTQLAINTSSRSYRYQINDARISLQASDVVIVGR